MADTPEARRIPAQAYLDVAEVMLVALDANARVVLVNRKGCRVLGRPREEILGASWFDRFIPEAHRAEVAARFAAIVAGEIEMHEYAENPIRDASGRERLIAWHNALVRDESGAVVGTLSSGEDVTERRRAEEERARLEAQLRTAQKLEAVAHLAGGLAHDFNNLVSVILGYADLVRERLRPEDPLRDDVLEIAKAGRRAAAITDQLLALGCRRSARTEVLAIDDVVRDLEGMLRRLLGDHIVVRRSTTPDLLRVKADRGGIEQAILNLAVNARDAMPNGGTLTIDARNVALDAAAAASGGEAPGTYVRLEVRDTGCGMDEATRERAFDPFFTSKEPGKGTGLGLAAVHGIVRGCGGTIALQSEPGAGTTVRIHLPATAEPAAATRTTTAATPEAGGAETILLVEDDDAVRRLAERMLRSAGYRVLAAGDGGDALLIAEQHDGPIDLLLTDVVMPRLNGPRLAERLRRIRPAARLVFMSGYAAPDGDAPGSAPDEPLPGPLVPKPIDRPTLLRAIRETLDSPSPNAEKPPGP
jgi:PAS domain S-box-containing protein